MAKKVFTDESLSTFVDEIKSYTDDAVSTKANSSHNHAASNITSGTLSSDRLPTVPIAKGGTGATTAAAALTNLGLTATAAELNKMDGVTATTAELNYVDGVTSNIQTQLDGKAASSHTHTIANITNLQTTLDGKASTAAATTSANGLMSSSDKTKLNATNIAYGTCATAAATAAKVITISGNTNWTLVAGSLISVKFTYTNTASNPTFNVNGTGAKSVWYNTALITTGSLSYAGYASRTAMYMYDGTQYVFQGWSLDNASDTKVTQAYSTTSASYPLLMSATSGVSSTSSRGAKTAIVNNQIYANPSTGALTATSFVGDLTGDVTGNASTATTATKVGSSTVGSATQPVYINAGTPTKCTYTLGASVPSGAVFTDTVYTHPSYTARTGVPTVNATLSFGGTFNVTQPVSDASGHITAMNTRTYTMPSDRLFNTLVPTGTAIPANANLNTTTYLKVGRYYCSSNANAATLTNSPLSTAFMMEVYSPLSTTIDNETTGTWVYRLRKMTSYSTGVQYIQYCSVGGTAGAANWTYGSWYVVPRSPFTLDASDSNGGSATIGSSTKPVYVASDGTLTACSLTAASVGAAASSHDHLSGLVSPAAIELTPASTSVNNGGYIDFHYNASTSDYTSRIIENSSGNLRVYGTSFQVPDAVPTTAYSRNILARTASMAAGDSMTSGRICLIIE